jgi:hypothetical protein
MVPQRTAFNSQYCNSCVKVYSGFTSTFFKLHSQLIKNAWSGHMGLPSSGGRGGSFTDQWERSHISLQLHTHWWWWIVSAVFTWTLNKGSDSMYRPKSYSLNEDWRTLKQSKQCIIWGYFWDHENEWKVWENLRSGNLKSRVLCIAFWFPAISNTNRGSM